MIEEIWKEIIWYEWKYYISNIGRIKSINWWRWNNLKEIILKPWKVSKYWHAWVRLQSKEKCKSYIVSRLVAKYFIPNPDNLPWALHKDETLDEDGFLYNGYDNIYWGTRMDNIRDMINKWRWSNYSNSSRDKTYWLWKFWKNNYSSKEIIQYTKSWEFIKKWDSIMDIERELWIHHPNISKVCLWKRESAWWFKWKYL